MFTTRLTPAQQQVLTFMENFQRTHRRPSTIREIAEALGRASSSGIHRHVLALARHRLVQHTGDRRTWTVVEDEEVDDHLFRVPVYGTIPAGLPADNPAAEDESVRIDPLTFGLQSTRNLIALHVRGDSMIDAQIADGDIALLRVQPAKPNDIVAALIDGQSTLKRLVKERSGHYLRGENARYKKREIRAADSLAIQGVLVAIIGKGRR